MRTDVDDRPRPRGTRAAVAAACALLLAGCASTPPNGDSPAGPSDGAAPEVTTVAEPAPAEPVVGDAPAPAAAPASTPKPKPKPWNVELKPGSAAALFDGIRVYLCQPAQPRKKAKGGAVATSLDQRLTVSAITRARSRPLVQGRPLRVCLDPGHGGEDSGALSRDGKTLEKTVALDLARRVKRMLEADGCEVMMTRNDDKSLPSLDARVARASRWKADLFVSLHLNANERNAPRGVETYATAPKGAESTAWTGSAPRPESKVSTPGNAQDVGNAQLGFCIQRRLVAASAMPDRGFRRARYIVLRDATMPAALVECGFVTNARDLEILRSSAGRHNIARGIYEGICDFALGTMEPGLPAHVSGTGGLGRPSEAPPSAPPVPQKAEGSRPISFVSGGDSRVPPYRAPKPQDGGDSASLRAAREAALRAAGF